MNTSLSSSVKQNNLPSNKAGFILRSCILFLLGSKGFKPHIQTPNATDTYS